MPKYGQILTFDRKVVETPSWSQNDRHWILSTFDHWSVFLKCFLNWLIGQLVIISAKNWLFIGRCLRALVFAIMCSIMYTMALTTAMNIWKNLKLIPTPFLGPRPCPNMGKILTFDRKVVDVPFWYQNDRNWILRTFDILMVFLKCFLNELIGQLAFLPFYVFRLLFDNFSRFWALIHGDSINCNNTSN